MGEVNANVGVGGALLSSFAVPVFLEHRTSDEGKMSQMFQVLTALSAMASLGTAALAIRNATAAKVVMPDGAHVFLEKSGGALVMPVRLYAISIMAAVAAIMVNVLEKQNDTSG